VLVPHRAGYTPVEIDDSHRVVAFGGAGGKATARLGAFLFTGYHLIEETILDAIPAGSPSDIVKEVYVPLSRERRLNAYVHRGFWWEFGTPQQYLEGSMRLISTGRERRARLGDFDPVKAMDAAEVALGPGADLHAERIALKGSLAIGLGVMVAERAMLEDSVVMPESWIGPGASLKRCIVGPGTEIPIGFEADNAIIVGSDSAGPLPAGVERISNLMVRRFDAATAA
jgi:NDP-sugar pyrophosphorylase family protein